MVVNQSNNLFSVPNINSRDAQIKKIIYKVEDLFNKSNKPLSTINHLCVCSGGTTSSCAKNNLITLDLRKEYNKISFEKDKRIATIGGGVLMKDLLNYLEKYNQIFPTGLSNLPGAGYILTGGISPLSRRYGLAIDNIEFVKGYLGNGDFINLKKSNLKNDEKLIWEAIKGAAPFLSIITEIGLRTYEIHPILIIEGFINEKEFSEIINIAENFPENFSLQWVFTEKIYVYILAELKDNLDKEKASKYLSIFKKFKSLKNKIYKNYNQINFFPSELNLYELNQNNYSEVISLLGKDLKNDIHTLIKYLKEINRDRPNRSCYVASQQLGCKTTTNLNGSSFFIHRECTWKPWIYASWNKKNLYEREIVMEWMNESWKKLKRFFPYIHLAQLHNHLYSHDEELILSFGERLDELKTLKNFCDPESILPPL